MNFIFKKSVIILQKNSDKINKKHIRIIFILLILFQSVT